MQYCSAGGNNSFLCTHVDANELLRLLRLQSSSSRMTDLSCSSLVQRERMSPPCGLEDQRLLQKYSYFLCQKLSHLFFRISSSSLLRSFNHSLPTTTAPAAVIHSRLPSLLCAARPVQSAAITARLYVTLSKQVSQDRVSFQRCRNTAAPLALPCNLSAGPSRRRQSSTRPGHSARSAPLFGVSGEAARRNRVGFALSVCALSLECHLICGRAPHSGSSNFLPFPPTPRPLLHR